MKNSREFWVFTVILVLALLCKKYVLEPEHLKAETVTSKVIR